MTGRFFFAQDDDSHWYMVPAGHRVEWDLWSKIDFDWEHEIARYLNNFRVGGGIEQYTFADPKEDK